MILEVELAELIRVFAITAVAAALGDLLRHRELAFLGVARWFFLGLVCLLAALHGWVYLVGFAGRPIGAANNDLLAACGALAISTGEVLFLVHVKRRIVRAMSPALQRRFMREDERLREIRRALNLAEEISHAGHWRYTPGHRVMVWSDEIYRIYGVDKAGFTPTVEAAMAAYHPEDRILILQAFETVFLQKTGFDVTARLIRADGQVRHVRSRGVPELDEAGNLVSLFSIFADITEQKQIEEDLRAANMLAEQANQALQALALLDGLTGLRNRRHFDGALELEFRQALRDGQGLGLIMIDLDRFKTFNDLYGHLAGDECLRRTAAAIAGIPRRPGDLVARFGGEEFVVLLPNTDEDGTRAVAEAIADAVRALQMEHGGNQPGFVTISCGVAVFQPARDPPDALVLIDRADRALYVAKQAGRNRVQCHAAAHD